MPKRTIADAEEVLRQMLAENGIDPDLPLPIGAVWQVFKEFVEVPFETASDGVLYEIGVFDLAGDDEFYLSFLRQFEALYEDGEHDHYEQLQCEYRFLATDEARAYGEWLRWWFAGEDSWAAFVAAVEQRPEFLALSLATPRAATLVQEEV